MPGKSRKAIEITDEMRAAVLAERCASIGHMFSLANAVVPVATDNSQVRDIQVVNDRLPHLQCSRCGKVWIVFDVAADNYDQAEEMIRAGAKDTTRIDELRKRRKAREETGGVTP